jgi:hypothetical protein
MWNNAGSAHHRALNLPIPAYSVAPEVPDTTAEQQTALQERYALAKLGKHVSPNPQGRLAKSLYAAFHAKPKPEELQPTVGEDIHYLNLLATRTLSPDLEVHVVKDILKTISQIPPDDQVDILMGILREIQKIGKTHHGFESQALDTAELLRLLATAAVNMRPDNPMQMEALKVLTDTDLMGRSREHLYQLPFDFSQPERVFSFAKRAIQHGSANFADALVCVNRLEFASIEYIDALTQGDGTAHSHLDQVRKRLVTFRACEELAELIGSQAARNCGVQNNQAPRSVVAGVAIAPHIVGTFAFTALKEGSVENHLEMRLKVLPFFNQSFQGGTENCGLTVEKSGQKILLSKIFREEFFNIKITSNAANIEATQAQKNARSRDIIKYLDSLDVRVFPSHERAERYKQFLQRILDVASNKPSIGGSLYLMPYLGKIHDKYNSSPEFHHVFSAPHDGEAPEVAEARKIFSAIESTLKANIASQLDALGEKPSLDAQDTDDLAELFLQLDQVFDKEAAAAARGKLLPLLGKVAPTHPKLPELVDALDMASSPAWRSAVDQLVTAVVRPALQPGTTRLVQGVRLLNALDRQLRAQHLVEGDSMVPVVASLMDEHLGRSDILATHVTDKELEPLHPPVAQRMPFGEREFDARRMSMWLPETGRQETTDTVFRRTACQAAARINGALETARVARLERTVRPMLDRCLPATGQGRVKLSQTQADVVSHWIARNGNQIASLEQARVLRLFTEDVLPPKQFMSMVGQLHWFSLEMPQLERLVASAEKLERTTERDRLKYEIPGALFFLMTQDLASLVSDHPESETQAALMARVQEMENRHIVRLQGVPLGELQPAIA